MHASSASRVIQIICGRGSCVAEQGDNGQFGTCWAAHSCNRKVERCSSHAADQVRPPCSPALRGRVLWVAEVCHRHFFCCALLARQVVDGGSGEARRVSRFFQHGSAIKEVVSLRCRRAGLEEETGALSIESAYGQAQSGMGSRQLISTKVCVLCRNVMRPELQALGCG